MPCIINGITIELTTIADNIMSVLGIPQWDERSISTVRSFFRHLNKPTMNPSSFLHSQFIHFCHNSKDILPKYYVKQKNLYKHYSDAMYLIKYNKISVEGYDNNKCRIINDLNIILTYFLYDFLNAEFSEQLSETMVTEHFDHFIQLFDCVILLTQLFNCRDCERYIGNKAKYNEINRDLLDKKVLIISNLLQNENLSNTQKHILNDKTDDINNIKLEDAEAQAGGKSKRNRRRHKSVRIGGRGRGRRSRKWKH